MKGDGGPAFPVIGAPGAPEDYPGLSIRDYFAARALPSTLSASASNDGSYDYVAAAVGAYMVADAMLEARKP